MQLKPKNLSKRKIECHKDAKKHKKNYFDEFQKKKKK